MDQIQAKSAKKLTSVTSNLKRYLHHQIDWKSRLIGIKGARGAGKTTLVLQHLATHPASIQDKLYVSLDDLYFSENSLVSLADAFAKQGGKILVLDEVHRYQQWSQEIKNIYDDHPDLQVIFTGSSMIHINQSKADLSRRAMVYELRGLSFREYLNLSVKKDYSSITMDELLKDHTSIAASVSSDLKPLRFFKEYFLYGYYPYSLEGPNLYAEKLTNTLLVSLENDLPALYEVQYSTIVKIKQLLAIVSESVPFKPNVAKLSERVGATRNSLNTYFHYLHDLRAITLLTAASKGISQLQKPEKIFLYHPNLHHALSAKPETGAMRESFFVNQVSAVLPVHYSPEANFLVDKQWTFEVGGPDKTLQQIKGIKLAYIAADGIEIGFNQKIPLWLFGFLY